MTTTPPPPVTRPVRHALGSWFVPPGDETFSPTPFVLPNNVRVQGIFFEATPLEHLGISGIVFGGLPVLFTPDRPTPLSMLQITLPVEGEENGLVTHEPIGHGWLSTTRFMGIRGMSVKLHMRNLGPETIRATAVLVGEEIVPRG